jgi:hypothetical protein
MNSIRKVSRLNAPSEDIRISRDKKGELFYLFHQSSPLYITWNGDIIGGMIYIGMNHRNNLGYTIKQDYVSKEKRVWIDDITCTEHNLGKASAALKFLFKIVIIK